MTQQLDDEKKESQNENNVNESFLPESLATHAFPAKYKNKYSVIPSYSKQGCNEKVFDGEIDRRRIYDTTNIDFHSRIGQLRMEFENLPKCYIGTATVFYINTNTKRVYAITCGHTLIHYNAKDRTIHKLKYIWFDRRRTKKASFDSYSESIIKYNIDKKWIHPLYDPKDDANEYDIGIVSFHDTGNFFSINCMNPSFNILPGTFSNVYENAIRYKHNLITAVLGASVANCPFVGASLYGYPGEKRKQLWGDKISNKKYNEVFKEFRNGKMISYKLHTSGGQSGSSILYRNGDGQRIVAIHTGGDSTTENWGVKIDPNINWIQGCVQSIENDKNKSNDILYLFQSNLKTKIKINVPILAINKTYILPDNID